MTLFYGFLASAVFMVFIGCFWPTKGKIHLLSFGCLTVAKSLWLSWIVVFCSYWLNLGDLSMWLLGGVVLLSVWRWYSPEITKIWFSANSLLIILSLLTICLLLSPLEAVLPFLDGQIVLSGWDVNASWNNWAMQLFENTYSPYIAAYPLFLPGLWALIYKAQANPMVWVMTRMLLFVFPLILLVQIGSLAVARRPLAMALVFLSLCGIFLANPLLLVGITDPIVMMLTLIAGIALYLGATSHEYENVDHYTLCASLFASVGAITKQPGMLTVVIVGLGVLLVGLRSLRSMSWYLVRLLVLLLPIASFMLIYYTTPALPTAFGNLGFLMSLTSKSSAGAGIYEHGWNYIVSMFGRFPLLVMLTFSLFNLVAPRRVINQIGFLYLTGFGVSFVAYSNCCAYDERNGWFLIAMLNVSAICGASFLEALVMREFTSLQHRFTFFLRSDGFFARVRTLRIAPLQLFSIALAVGVAGVLQLGVGEQRYLDAAKNARRTIVWPSVNNLAYTNIDSLGHGLIITNYPFISLLPDLEKRYHICPDTKCVVKTIEQYPGSRVLMGPESFDYSALRAVLKTDDYIGSEVKYGFSLTRGLTIRDLSGISPATLQP